MMQTRLQTAMDLRGVDARSLMLDVCAEESGGPNVVLLRKPITRERLRSLIDGPCTPTDAEARRLGVVLDFPPQFFQLEPIVVGQLSIHDPRCHCGDVAVVACDLCDAPFCHRHAPPEGPPGFHACGCWMRAGK